MSNLALFTMTFLSLGTLAVILFKAKRKKQKVKVEVYSKHIEAHRRSFRR